ncbi:MAG: hypothetical protein SPH68_05570 [Candidatus Borkfalkiaceae bacterium]|nr:hypothetical protein [Clostridia bacterium]MDY6223608.1 hypothetical protein [Christensenellaceae bacterium]
METNCYHNRRNPVLPVSIHIPDPEARVMPDGKLYIYGSLDVNSFMYCNDRYITASTYDMENREVSDEIFNAKQVSWYGNNSEPQVIPKDSPTLAQLMKLEMKIAVKHPKRCIENIRKNKQLKKEGSPLLFAPDSIYKDGKYYLYFCASDNSERVAVADNPTGQFVNPYINNCMSKANMVYTDNNLATVEGQTLSVGGILGANDTLYGIMGYAYFSIPDAPPYFFTFASYLFTIIKSHPCGGNIRKKDASYSPAPFFLVVKSHLYGMLDI